MSAPCIISASLPSFCQKLSKLVEIWWSCDKNNFAQFFWDTVYINGSQTCYNVNMTQMPWTVVTSEIIKLFQPSSTSVWNNFISARGNMPKIISNLFHRLIATHEYFRTCSLLLKWFWNNFRQVSTCWNKIASDGCRWRLK